MVSLAVVVVSLVAVGVDVSLVVVVVVVDVSLVAVVVDVSLVAVVVEKDGDFSQVPEFWAVYGVTRCSLLIPPTSTSPTLLL